MNTYEKIGFNRPPEHAYINLYVISKVCIVRSKAFQCCSCFVHRPPEHASVNFEVVLRLLLLLLLLL